MSYIDRRGSRSSIDPLSRLLSALFEMGEEGVIRLLVIASAERRRQEQDAAIGAVLGPSRNFDPKRSRHGY